MDKDQSNVGATPRRTPEEQFSTLSDGIHYKHLVLMYLHEKGRWNSKKAQVLG